MRAAKKSSLVGVFLPRGIVGSLRGVLQVREGIHERASAGTAPLNRWAAHRVELVDALRGALALDRLPALVAALAGRPERQ